MNVENYCTHRLGTAVNVSAVGFTHCQKVPGVLAHIHAFLSIGSGTIFTCECTYKSFLNLLVYFNIE